MSNEYSRPAAAPPPMFIGKKERDLISQITTEVQERVVGQAVFYYPIDIERSNFHKLYGESICKTFLPPIRIYCAVEWQGMSTEATNVGIDKMTSIKVFFHKRRITEDQDLYVREGDFVKYGNFFFEIVKLEEVNQIAGQIEHIYEISATCKRARKGTFDAK
jgi:hypothetical protein